MEASLAISKLTAVLLECLDVSIVCFADFTVYPMIKIVC